MYRKEAHDPEANLFSSQRSHGLPYAITYLFDSHDTFFKGITKNREAALNITFDGEISIPLREDLFGLSGKITDPVHQ